MESVQGAVEIQRASVIGWQRVQLGNAICAGDTVRIGRNARAGVLLANETMLRLDQETTVTFSQVATDKPSWLELLKGALYLISRTPKSLEIKTPFVNAGIEGTEFLVRVEAKETRILVFEGRIRASNEQGSLSLASGQMGVARAGQAPQASALVRPRDAVQWTLYFPPLTDFHAAAQGAAADAIKESLDAFETGDLGVALARLEQVPAKRRDATYHTFRAALLLTVGRLDRAAIDLDRALAIDPNNGTALAWRSLIAVVRNENEKAQALATRAVAADPTSSIPQTALSYAYQASFDLDRALESAEQATRLDPQDALAWARLAELFLSSGELDRALEAAQEAVARNPKVSLTQSVLGFAYLTRIEIKEARAAFEKAIELDQADPLPRLGMGLAIIRDGSLADGREEIEIATGLDPNNSLIRSYLGKAYFEEKRDPLAASQFALAKALDPKDPTPWLYDAILKQTENRPVEALRDVQRSIELNDNRAVYRSRLLLDSDRAARGASLARIYNDLGFEQLGVNEASRSLALDPSSAPAHRFLSDIYRARPRHEIARVSELLQAQLLQDININPIQPSLNETDLGIIARGGPTQVGFHEFTPLFERNQARLNVAGLVGDLGTVAGETVASAIYDKVSLSAGAFHFETDGFRRNNDVANDIYNAFVQFAVTPAFNVQAEYRYRETNHGDVSLRFDLEDFSDVFRRNVRQSVPRVGAHLALSPGSDVIVSAFYGQLEEDQDFGIANLFTEDKGHQVEAQYLFRGNRFNFTAGGGVYRIDVKQRLSVDNEVLFENDFTSEQETVYVWTDLRWPDPVIWTAGLSYDHFEERGQALVDAFSPKLGMQWDISDQVHLRLAYAETTKRALLADQSIEPTQVAGFNLRFDDFNGTIAARYGVGLSARVDDTVYGGIEASRRDLNDVPVFDPEVEGFRKEAHVEDLYRAYLYWTPHVNWSLSAECRFEMFEIEERIFSDARPSRMKTFSAPVAAQYFNPSGFFAGIGAVFVNQDIELGPFSNFESENDNFVLVDASIGYRLPKRSGVVSVGVSNLLDETFSFHDDNFRNSKPTLNPRFSPDRTVLASITLNF